MSHDDNIITDRTKSIDVMREAVECGLPYISSLTPTVDQPWLNNDNYVYIFLVLSIPAPTLLKSAFDWYSNLLLLLLNCWDMD